MSYYVVECSEEPPNTLCEVVYSPQTDSWGRVVNRQWREVARVHLASNAVPEHQGYKDDVAYHDPRATDYHTIEIEE